MDTTGTGRADMRGGTARRHFHSVGQLGAAACLAGFALVWLLGVQVAGLDAMLVPGAGLGVLVALFAATRFGGIARRAAFRDQWHAVPDPAFLVEAGGRILAANPAAAVRPGDLSATLAGRLTDAEGVVYRLRRTLRNAPVARDGAVVWDGAPATLHAHRTGTGAQIWRVLAEATVPAVPVTFTARDAGCTGPTAALPRPDDDTILDDLPVGLARIRADGCISYINRAAQALLGDGARPGTPLTDVIEGLPRPIPERLAQTMTGRAQGRSEVARARRDGADVFLQVTMTRMQGAGKPGVMAVISDATELKTLEAQFVQSQKMQAVGQLAGGIAHDFNNLLTAIHGHCDLLLLRHDAGDTDHGDLIQIRQNANRAAALVRQLLAFSRKQTLRLNVLHLYDTMAELAHLLNRLLGEKVRLDIANAEDIWPVRVDERQLEQVVVNLVVNARDAMPDGGIVRLRTRNVALAQQLCRDRATVPAGRYSVIEVEDTGTGIPQNQLSKIFEPFYTTKRVGEGTGLGLSTAYGIVKQSGGYIFVDSEVGKGSRFVIYLPVHEGQPQAETAQDASAVGATAAIPAMRDLTGRSVILLVEDEASVRSFATRALTMRGYTVLEADCGEAALALLAETGTRVDLFVSDVVMPGLDGPSWVREALKARPDVSTIFMSGYAEDVFRESAEPIPRSSFLAKPFSLADFTSRVRDHIDTYGAPQRQSATRPPAISVPATVQ